MKIIKILKSLRLLSIVWKKASKHSFESPGEYMKETILFCVTYSWCEEEQKNMDMGDKTSLKLTCFVIMFNILNKKWEFFVSFGCLTEQPRRKKMAAKKPPKNTAISLFVNKSDFTMDLIEGEVRNCMMHLQKWKSKC